MPEAWGLYGALFLAGLVAGTLNVIAGGGSFLTLPALILLGLPATAANATNRVGIVFQNVGAVWSFRRHGLFETRWTWTAALPSCAGAVGGAVLALWISDAAFKRMLVFLMIAVTLWTLWDPVGRIRRARGGGPASPLAVGAAFFVVGIYGGFVQAGVGFFLLAVTTYAGYDLVKGNSLKVYCALLFTIVSVVIFAAAGQIVWAAGVVLGLGNMIGGLLGVRLAVLKGHRWLKGVVTVTIIALAIKLWLTE